MTKQPRTAAPLDARESLRHQLRTFTDHSNGSIHVDEPGDVDAFLDAILQTGAWKPVAVPLDRAKVDHIARYLRRRYYLRQSIPELVMGLDNALASADEEGTS